MYNTASIGFSQQIVQSTPAPKVAPLCSNQFWVEYGKVVAVVVVVESDIGCK